MSHFHIRFALIFFLRFYDSTRMEPAGKNEKVGRPKSIWCRAVSNEIVQNSSVFESKTFWRPYASKRSSEVEKTYKELKKLFSSKWVFKCAEESFVQLIKLLIVQLLQPLFSYYSAKYSIST